MGGGEGKLFIFPIVGGHDNVRVGHERFFRSRTGQVVFLAFERVVFVNVVSAQFSARVLLFDWHVLVQAGYGHRFRFFATVQILAFTSLELATRTGKTTKTSLMLNQ